MPLTRTSLCIRVLAAATFVWPAPASSQDGAILGIWWTELNKGRVEIKNCVPPKQGLCGTIIWISQPNDAQGRPLTDNANKNRALRSRPIIGLPIFEEWRAAGTNKWTGKIYDPDEGEIYDIDISPAGGKLILKGCFQFNCETHTWNRYRG